MVYKLQRFSIILANDVVRWYCKAAEFDTLSCKQSFVIPTLIKDRCVVRFLSSWGIGSAERPLTFKHDCEQIFNNQPLNVCT